ncbi:hypothetical protein E2P81_ATG07537 [Venturia nashicola]|nr:hypothetical protein E2P81_ATG07537 [Venturia nashicola]
MCYSIPETQKQGGVPEPQFTETSITLLPRPKICCLLPAEKDSIPTPGTQIRGPKARPTSRTVTLNNERIPRTRQYGSSPFPRRLGD